MIVFVLHRLLQAVAVMMVVGFIAFSLFTYVGDPVNNMVGLETTVEERLEIRERLGLNDPFFVQYGRFLADLDAEPHRHQDQPECADQG